MKVNWLSGQDLPLISQLFINTLLLLVFRLKVVKIL